MSSAVRRRRRETPATVTIAPATITKTHPSTHQFTVTVKNVYGTTLTGTKAAGIWTSATPAKGTINQSGLATTVAAGTSSINFTTTRAVKSATTPAVLTVS
jgi:hypothetical protein